MDIDRISRIISEIAPVEKIRKIEDSKKEQIENQLRDEGVTEKRFINNNQPNKSKKKLKKRKKQADIDNIVFDKEGLYQIITEVNHNLSEQGLGLRLSLEEDDSKIVLVEENTKKIIRRLTIKEALELYRRDRWSHQGISINKKG